MFVILDKLLRKFPIEDVLSGDDEASLGYLFLISVNVVDLGEVLAGV